MTTAHTVFVTGGSGFIGSRVIKSLAKPGYQLSQLEGDLLDFDSVKNQVAFFLKTEAPSKTILHLAGLSSPPFCEKNPLDAFKVNVLGTSILLESLRQNITTLPPHFIFASTAHVYDTPAEGKPITEDTPIKIKNVYAETKIQAESIIRDFSTRNAMKSTVLRLFNHAHISQSKDFFIPSLYHQINDLHSNEHQVKVGNLDLYRDIGTLPDLLQALELIVSSPARSLLQNNFEIFNICSGQAHHLLEIAKKMALYLKRPDIEFVTEPSRLRVGEIKNVFGSFDKIKSAYGWTPRHTDFENFFKDV